MFINTTSELAPEEDEGALFAILNGPRYATKEYTQLYTDQISAADRDIPEVSTEFSITGFGGQANKGFYIWVLEEWAERERSQAEFQQEVQGLLGQVAGVEGFAFAPPTLPGLRRRPADLGGHPVDPRRRARLRGGRGGPAEGAGVRPLHRGAEQPRLRRAAGDRHDRPRPGGGAQRADQRDRHHPRPPGRRRLDRPVRPRVQQLRRDHPGAARVARQPRRPSAASSCAPPTARWCRCPRWSTSRPTPRRRRSSSSTSSTPRRSRRCRCPASRPATGSP